MRRRCAAVFTILLFPLIASAGPLARFEASAYDFGVIGQGDKAAHIFQFSNRGDGDLVIEKVSPS